MLITSIRLRNFCQYVDKVIEFCPQLNVIVGPNGCGKSTVLNAILFALTGVNRLPGKNQENVSQFAGPNEESFVDLRFAHRGKTYAITRSLQPTDTMTLTVDDGPIIRGVTKCTERIFEDIGTNTKRLQDYVFVEQKKVDGWFDKPPAERSREMATLFGLDDAELAYKAIDKFNGKIRLPELIGDIDKLANEHATEATFLQTLTQQLAAFADVPDDISGYLEVRNQVRLLWQQKRDAAARRQELASQLQTVTSQTMEHHQRRAGLQSEASEYDAAIAGMQDAVTTAQHEQIRWQTYKQSLELQTMVELRISEVFKSWQNRPRRPARLPQHLTPEGEMALTATLTGLLRQKQVLDVSIAAIEKLPADKPCPTCGAVGSERQAHLVKLKSELDALQQKLAPLQQQSAEHLAYTQAFVKYSQAVQSLRDLARSAKRQRSTLQMYKRPLTDESTLQQVVADFAVLQSAKHQVQTDLAAVEATLTALARQHRDLLEEENRLLMQHNTPGVTAEAYERAIAEQQQMQSRYQEKKSLETHVVSHTARVTAILQRITNAQEALERYRKTTYATTQLDAAKAILHHSAAPRTVTRVRLGMLMEDINTALQLFDAPFHVNVDEELTFWAHFRDGQRKQSDRRLSVGQRVTLALSWRVALNTAFAGSLGLLALDEPTAGLDVKNLGCVPRAFARLRDLSQTRGLQVLLVTHEERLIDSFDKVISL